MQGTKQQNPRRQAGVANGTRIDYKLLKAQVQPRLLSIAEYLFPGGTVKAGEYVVANHTRNEKKAGSFSINIHTGVYFDQQSGDKGDVLSLWQYARGGDLETAAKEMTAYLALPQMPVSSVPEHNNQPKGTGISRVHDDPVVGPIYVKLPDDSYSFSDIYLYRDESGSIVGGKLKFRSSVDGKKEFRPFTHLGSNKNKTQKPAAGWPPYRAPELAAELKTDHPQLMIFEGEKDAESAAALGVVATSFGGASDGVPPTWRERFKGAGCVIWQDNDPPGIKRAKLNALVLHRAEAKVKVIVPPIGKDFSDYLEALRKDKLDDATVCKRIEELVLNQPIWMPESEHMAAGIVPVSDSEGHPSATLMQLSNAISYGQFKNADEGLFYYPYASRKDPDARPFKIAARLDITGAARDASGESWCLVLEFKDRAGGHHIWCMPLELLGGEGNDVIRQLLNKGLWIAPGVEAKRLLLTYVQSVTPSTLARCVTQPGWYQLKNGTLVRVTSQEIIGGSEEERIILQSETISDCSLAQKGSVEEWRKEVSVFCSGNSRLHLGVSMALAAPLLFITSDENAGLLINGGSSSGKTTALLVAASVFGSSEFMRTFRGTMNGLEGLARDRNDLLLILDEIGQAHETEIGQFVYGVGNRRTKQRADKTGRAKRTEECRTILLTAGEMNLSARMGKLSNAGQEVRLIDLPADAGAGLGLFENLHSESSGEAFADRLKSATRKHYGAVGRRWLELLAKSPDTARELVREFKAEFTKMLNLNSISSGQVKRVAAHFALFAAAGELATRWELTGWHQGEAISAAVRCFSDWLSNKGSSADFERDRILSRARLFFEQHGESRFTRFNEAESENTNQRTFNRAGFRKDFGDYSDFFVTTEVFGNEFCGNSNRKTVIEVLTTTGWLVPGADSASTVQTVPGLGSTRLYRFSGRKIFE